MSYSIDVYRGIKKPEKHFGIFALYVSFFPQLVAGPIERSTQLLPQFFKKIDFDFERVKDGLKFILWGMFKKVVIADRLALLVDPVYANPEAFNGKILTIATVFFAFQIYCDFSGYSDIAIGSARILGYDLMDNFRRPYFSASIPEFWKRWHISLSTWFKDYVYFPLGGKRVTFNKWLTNIFIVFTLSGIWHGANITFLVWGVLHGIYYVTGIWTKPFRENIAAAAGLSRFPFIHRSMKRLITFTLVCFAWIYFRSDDLTDAWHITTNIFKGWDMPLRFAANMKNAIPVSAPEFYLSVSLIIFMETIHSLQEKGSVRKALSVKPEWFRWVIYLALSLAIMNLGIIKEIPFIYFQF
jgi:D-alanyl-lipoteichoic acid acyltransferase DltB (MBOAT superfamily)